MANYFSLIQNIRYSLQDDGTEIQQVKNIFARSKILKRILDNTAVYSDYAMQEYDTPESVAHKFYGDVNKHWLVMFSNFVVDPYFDFALSDFAFQKYIKKKYGTMVAAQSTIHHTEEANLFSNIVLKKKTTRFITNKVSQYEYNFATGEVSSRYMPDLNDGDIELSSETLTAPDGTECTISRRIYSISNYDYEYYLNEAKRNIKLIDRAYATLIENELKTLMAK